MTATSGRVAATATGATGTAAGTDASSGAAGLGVDAVVGFGAGVAGWVLVMAVEGW